MKSSACAFFGADAFVSNREGAISPVRLRQRRVRCQALRAASTSVRNALLLRVGIDRGTGGALGPIFPDGTFEYIPIPEMVPTRCPLTYATLAGRHVASLATVLPARLAGRPPHIDPDFSTATYGDAAPRKRQQLFHLTPGDLLVFYTGLSPRPPEDQPKLFAIGYITVRRVHDLRAGDLGHPDLRRRFGRTAHFLRRPRDRHLVLVEGNPVSSRLFAQAVPLGDGRDCLLRDLSAIGYRGSLLRAVGHWIRTAGLSALEAWLQDGPAGLVQPDTRLIPVAAPLPPVGKTGDLVVDDRRLREGDWILALAESDGRRIQALGRVNRVFRRRGRNAAFSSIYWYFKGGGPVVDSTTSRAIARKRIISDPPLIRHVVSQLDSHYRIGLHQAEHRVVRPRRSTPPVAS